MRNKINYRGAYTIFKWQVLRFLKFPTQTLASPVITTTLYFVVFGYSIGNRVGEIDGISYIKFIVPGLIMMSLLMNAYTSPSSNILLSKVLNTLVDVLSAPISALEFLVAYSLAGAVRGIVVAIVIYIVSLFFAGFTITSWFYLFGFLILTSWSFAIIGVIAGVWASRFEQVFLLPTYVITPLTFLGGVFYSIKMIPPILQKVSLFNPIFYMIDGLRYSFYGIYDVPPLRSLIFVFFAWAVLFAIAYHVISKGYKLKT
ncbi:MAG: hypothetical protein COT81_03285 [Candidatus Buchananbacteria bacterium CG10_big_fil_rev_8_21_14_0_10_42_9]|uniref:Transport permease protein n=1 Tax=Candidatus Buchananbacteria bacterium CG10_big_fil_rev_8_21_14_0_10_42_9 TaxID=1974526 RepID=A0A2H0W133_9BACT|nr:MAG: hypothetical protein COT81_03285 [Candidatus Buchananbacteria bacterium CG10_big_fil_rev_8_21_14_0_10_42_9]